MTLQREDRSEPGRRTASLSRLLRLQVLLLVVLGLWSIESGMQTVDDSSSGLPAVASAAPSTSLEATSASLAEVSSSASLAEMSSSASSAATSGASPEVAISWRDIRALQVLLDAVNPNLAPSETERIASAVLRYSAKYRLDPELVTAVLLVESTARPWVRSPKGAVGLMQVMPHMMEPLGLAGNAATIESNIEAGCWILANNIRRLGEEQGISSYFWGSDIRGSGYLEKVQAARSEVRRQLAS